MRLGDYLGRDRIIPELTSATKAEVLRELVAPLGEKDNDFDVNLAVSVLLERENLGTTGIGDGIAIPHGKLENLDEIAVVVGRSSTGIDFDALDKALCHIFFLVLAPEQVAGQHLRVLAHISRLLKDVDFRSGFLEAPDGEQLWSLVQGV
ncbi:MAG: PTS sugar transporter subunit IIA [Proteobacteria bacterium]|nr:PTS sugar transporter subunit IIA [Pseudomonadota bacterium]MBU1612085.1 PTS sugar transporter subunit IIA [Pseudomonadota bacterium]